MHGVVKVVIHQFHVNGLLIVDWFTFSKSYIEKKI